MDSHELRWMSDGVRNYRWECVCGFRPATNWPRSAQTWRAHLEQAAA